jgi:diguanylate cyclase (GGDEF)-like protein
VNATPLTILLIEDNPGDVLLLRETLEESGIPFEIVRVERLQEGIDRVQRQSFDLVMLDLSLPDSAGTATIARAGKAFWKMPVIVLTALDDDQMGLKALQFGAQDYLVKSQVTPALLLRSVRYAKARHREREILLRASLIDDLTGLYNRRGFLNVAGEELSSGSARGHGFLVVFADLDGLKQINDTHGHAAGDWAIGKAAEVLKLCFGPDDVVGRIGGDEFVGLVTHPLPNGEQALRDAASATLLGVNRSSGRPYELGISLGFHRPAPGEEVDLEALLSRADEALYEAKRAKKGQG